MKLKETIDSLIEKPVEITIKGCRLFPFGTGSESNLMLKQHSNGYYCVFLGSVCVFIISILEVSKYEITIEGDEVFDVKWDGFRIVNLDNV